MGAPLFYAALVRAGRHETDRQGGKLRWLEHLVYTEMLFCLENPTNKAVSSHTAAERAR
jgi:hypothetical protein